MPSLTRRRVLATAGALSLASLAGCSAITGPNTPEPLDFEALHTEPVYVDDAVDLSLPAEIETVNHEHNAALLVLHAATEVGAEQAAEWLADDRLLALLGDAAEATWLDWARSEAFDDTFGTGGLSDAEPDPDLLVGATIGIDLRTYRYTWGDGPRDRDVLRALDETLVDVEDRTPA